ncbi:Nucleotide-binding universal stress protein, UspA family [Tistlia consotensis]|uniref:Nucleotide-binding universal stress protein, UspA family n=1 Tax=Tistlia consotensis USBA 355 TaxID=560819 RepID=A0A1Y6CFP0_9PROT|nr:universal stress protein [Tistlia consotensis]SMF60835.1 Nucleotide-binding universal stress protein, UspA family [Tistlia consotensis USBA 355]SNR92650.1 Nucleotide-binding universal stress protein, UspA family [Tistlia consotensis]
MTYRSILAVLDGSPASNAPLQAAFALGRRFDAYLEVLHVRPDPNLSLPLVGEGMSGALIDDVARELEESAKTNAERARRFYEDACRSVDLAPTDAGDKPLAGGFRPVWRSLVGREDSETAARGLLADLIVVARPDPGQDGAYAPALEAGLFETGRPVLVVPPSHQSLMARKVAIAWNATRESTRAAAAALPLLVEAESVTVLSVAESSGGQAPDPARLADYLVLHGVEARSKRVEAQRHAGNELISQASELGAELLVMGAYGHSRLREFVLGGATRDVLTNTEVPVLLAH